MTFDTEQIKTLTKRHFHNVVDAVKNPQTFYENKFLNISENDIWLVAGALTLLQGLTMSVVISQYSSFFSNIMQTVFGVLVGSGVVYGVGKTFMGLERTFKEVLLFISFIAAIAIPINLVSLVFFGVFSTLPMLAGVGFSLYLFWTGGKSFLKFSNMQLAFFCVVPTGFAVMALAIASFVSPLASLVTGGSRMQEEFGNEKVVEYWEQKTPKLVAGETYTYEVTMTQKSKKVRGYAIAKVQKIVSDKVTLVLSGKIGRDKFQKTYRFSQKTGGLSIIDFSLQQDKDTSTNKVAEELLGLFITGQSDLIDAGLALAQLPTFLVSKAKLKEAGLDISLKPVSIAGRKGFQRYVQEEKNNKFSIARDRSLSLPLLEYRMNNKGKGDQHIRLKSYKKG